jgi:hypothetical protein
VITVHELEIGILLVARRDRAQGQTLRSWMDRHVCPALAGRIRPVDTAVAQRSAQFHVPATRPLKDGLIAATALVHGLTVVRRNVADFEPSGVVVLKPWEARWLRAE